MKPSHDRAFRAMQNGMVTRRVFARSCRSARGLAPRVGSGTMACAPLRSASAGHSPGRRSAKLPPFALVLSRMPGACAANRRPAHQPEPRISGAAGQCLLRLGTLLAVCFVIARLLPGVAGGARSRALPGEPRRHPDSDLGINGSVCAHHFAGSLPRLERHAPALLRRIRVLSHGARNRIALRAARFAVERHPRQPQSVFAAWIAASVRSVGKRRMTAACPPRSSATMPGAAISLSIRTIAGRVIHIGNRTARIAGVMPYGMWRLPGEPDAWLLEPDSQLAHASPQRPRLPRRAPVAAGTGLDAWGWVPITVRAAEYDDTTFYGVSFASRLRGPGRSFSSR